MNTSIPNLQKDGHTRAELDHTMAPGHMRRASQPSLHNFISLARALSDTNLQPHNSSNTATTGCYVGYVGGSIDALASGHVMVPRIQQHISRLLRDTSPSGNELDKKQTGNRIRTSFINLPLEIRENIYLFALCPGEVYPHGKPIDTGRKYSARETNGICSGETVFQRPSLALLQTCTQVYDEALPMYLSLNRFVIQEGGVFGSMRFMTGLPDNKLRHIKSLVLKFSQGDLAERDRESAKGEALAYMRENGGMARYTREERQDTIHLYEMNRLRQIWYEKYDYLVNLATIKDITLDFSEIECPTGCCDATTLGLETAKWLGAYGDNLPRSRVIKAEHDQEAIEQVITNVWKTWSEA